MQITGIDFGYFGIPAKKLCSHSTILPHLSNATNSEFIVDLSIIVFLDDFHKMVAPASVNT